MTRRFYTPKETITAVELVFEGIEMHAQTTLPPTQEELAQEAEILARDKARQERAILEIDSRLAAIK